MSKPTSSTGAPSMQQPSVPVSRSSPSADLILDAQERGTAEQHPAVESDSYEDTPEVETTNWNAVRMLASKYGVTLGSWTEVKKKHEESLGVDGPHNNQSLDLGAGTPFKITARPIDGGRTIFRFHLRNSNAKGRSWPRPRPPSGQRLAAAEDPEIGAFTSSDVTVGSDQAKKQGIKAMSTARSIPGLRARPSNGFLKSMGQSVLPTSSGQNRSVSAQNPPSQSRVADIADRTKASSRSASTPFRQPLPAANERVSNKQASLQGGDVLGAILGLSEDITVTPPSSDAPARGLSLAGLFFPAKQRTTTLQSRAFGSAIAIDPKKLPSAASALSSEAQNGTRQSIQGYRVTWDRSPIPQIENVGDPLFEDIEAFTGSKDHAALVTEPQSAATDNDSANPSRQLREMLSFETTASTTTARPASEDLPASDPATHSQSSGSDIRTKPPRTVFGDPTQSHIFDVFQRYESHNHSAASPQAGTKSRSRSSSLHSFARQDMRRMRSSSVEGALEGHLADESFGKASRSSAQDTATDAAPTDDPRFVLWAMPDAADTGNLLLSDRYGSSDQADGSSLEQAEHAFSASVSAATSGAISPSQNPPSSLSKRWSNRIAHAGEGSAGSPSLPHSSRQRMPSSNSTTSHHSASAHHKSLSAGVLTRNNKASAIAATPARLIAELTAEIHSRLMTDFFYTFRAFMSTQELLDLLIARFHWALSEPDDPQDDARRRIVRVRTYVVIKYWITNFFEVDFLGDKAVRTSLTEWLNALGSDPRLPNRPADLSIVQSLKKAVRNLKHAYAKTGFGALLRHEIEQRSSPASGSGSSQTRSRTPSSSSSSRDNATTGRISAGPSLPRLHAPFRLESSRGDNDAVGPTPRQTSNSSDRYDDPHTISSSHGRQNAATGSVALPTSPGSPNNALSRAFATTVGRFSRLRKTIGHHLVPHGSENEAEAYDFASMDTGDLLYMRGGVANLIEQFQLEKDDETANEGDDFGAGTSDELGNTDETPSLSASSAISRSTPASSIEINERQDEAADEDSMSNLGLGIKVTSDDSRVEPEGNQEDVEIVDSGLLSAISADSPSLASRNPSENQGARLQAAWKPSGSIRGSSAAGIVHHADSDQTLRSWMSSSTGGANVIRHPSVRALQEPRSSVSSSRLGRRRSADSCHDMPARNVVQIDEIDLSSDEDDGAVRRALRRLPGARDLRKANNIHNLRPERQSLDSLASFGRVHTERDRTSLAPSIKSFRPRTSLRNSPSHTDLFDPDEALAGYELVKGFRVEDFQSDDEEPGDVDEALRRLEGFIDDDKKAERARRVETLWEQSQARKEENAQRAESNRNEESMDDSADADVEGSNSSDSGLDDRAGSDHAVSKVSDSNDEADESLDSVIMHDGLEGEANNRKALPAWLAIQPDQGTASTPRKTDPHSSEAEVHGPERLSGMEAAKASKNQQRQQRAPARVPGQAGGAKASAVPYLPPHVLNGPAPIHRCFLLNYKSEVIAQQFTLIESELFKAVDWTELVCDRWRERRHKAEVLDWESFYQARVRAKAAAAAQNKAYRDTAVEAIIARFNLTCNWVASEVVLTRNLEERVAVISKLIRVAFRCYQYLNFSTVVQICLGLQTPWVERLTKTWARVNSRDLRILRDLKALTSPARNFRHLRAAMRGMVEEGSLEELVTVNGPPQTQRGGSASGGLGAKGIGVRMEDCCVPFFGLFITDLAVNECLPSLIDPSSPNSAAEIDPDNPRRLLKLQNPSAFAHLPPLPSNIELEPLVNLFKFRNIAGTVKAVLAFQAKAANYNFHADAGVYVKCLKIRCLEGRHMTDLSNRLEP
ncbi:unnamed protein product [Sympodiomycopsis kandeliae]